VFLGVHFSRTLVGVCSAFTVYVIAGYPSILAVLARRKGRPVRRAPYFPRVSFIVASHNGAPFLPKKLESIAALDYPNELVEVIIVDDGSTDDTAQVLTSLGESITVVRSDAKLGKSGALQLGIDRARHEVLAFTDVRQTLAPDSLRLLLENLADESVGAVSAELQIASGDSAEEYDTGAYWRYERWIRHNLSSIDSIFGASGSYYAIHRSLVGVIAPGILNDDMYIPLPAFFSGYRLVVDRRAHMFDLPTNLSVEFWRKVRTLAGNYQLIAHFPQLLTGRNRLLWHFLSYKLGRLFLPFALCAGAAASFYSGRSFAVVSGSIQAAAAALAIVDPLIPKRSPIKRLSSPLRSFLTMMAATACAASILFVPPERLWQSNRISRGDASA
jgi:poly-beta-1,6-N-acetyl-D-glucosamine synthase